MEIWNVESTIENEIRQGATQKDIASTYGLGLRSSYPTDWKRVNEAILARWPKGLARIKDAAWKGSWNGVPFGSAAARPVPPVR
jgi:hexokinase